MGSPAPDRAAAASSTPRHAECAAVVPGTAGRALRGRPSRARQQDGRR